MRLLRTIPVLVAAMIAGAPALAAKNPNTIPTRVVRILSCSDAEGGNGVTGDTQYCAGANTIGSVSTYPTPVVSVFASSYATATPENFSDYTTTTGALLYEFIVWGGNIGDIVPLTVKPLLIQETSLSFASQAFAKITIAGQNGIVPGGIKAICSPGTPCGNNADEYEGIMNLSLRAGQLYTMTLEASVSVRPDYVPSFASAVADPYISIDPSFANAAQYSIAVPAGIGNEPPVPAVPEPSSWIMMAAGLGVAAVAAKRRATLRPA